MLDTVGVKSLEDLYSGFEDLWTKNLNLPPGKSQMEVIRFFTELASQNKLFGSIFRGAGAYCHYIPSVIKSLVSREEFVTAYTPYQAEM